MLGNKTRDNCQTEVLGYGKEFFMKVDLGGYGKYVKGWTTVNMIDACNIRHDLDNFPYPFKANSIEELRCLHTLEHLEKPLEVMKEIYRICRHNANVIIEVPYWKEDFPPQNPMHKHIFGEKWFRNLNPASPIWFGGMEGTCPLNLEIISVEYLRYPGSRRFWEKHKMRVMMRAVK